MIAWLGMYDMPALRAAHDRLWEAMRETLGYGPDRLTREGDPWEIWRSPDLLLAQTCGMPLRTRLYGHVTLVATPDHGLEGCPPGHYRSILVVHRDAPGDTLADFDATTLAYNEPVSQSGWAAPVTHLTASGIRPGKTLRTGAHVASARAVATGEADIAGIDAVTWELLKRHDRVSDTLRVIDVTAPTPALPYITALGRDAPACRTALEAAIAALSPEDRDTLHLRGVVDIPAAAYLAVPNPPAP